MTSASATLIDSSTERIRARAAVALRFGLFRLDGRIGALVGQLPRALRRLDRFPGRGLNFSQLRPELGNGCKRLGPIGLKLAALQDQLVVCQGGEHRSGLDPVADIGFEAFDRQPLDLWRHQHFLDSSDHAVGEDPVGDVRDDGALGDDRRRLRAAGRRGFSFLRACGHSTRENKRGRHQGNCKSEGKKMAHWVSGQTAGGVRGSEDRVVQR